MAPWCRAQRLPFDLIALKPVIFQCTGVEVQSRVPTRCDPCGVRGKQAKFDSTTCARAEGCGSSTTCVHARGELSITTAYVCFYAPPTVASVTATAISSVSSAFSSTLSALRVSSTKAVAAGHGNQKSDAAFVDQNARSYSSDIDHGNRRSLVLTPKVCVMFTR